MLRFYVVIILSAFDIAYFVPKMASYAKKKKNKSREEKYALAQQVIRKMSRTAKIDTEAVGVENLPCEGGYIMYANHQGKYDALAVMREHKRFCSALMDSERAKMFIAKQFMDLTEGVRIEKGHPRQQIRALTEIADRVRDGGDVFLIFPEGGYGKKVDNTTEKFNYGCFISAYKAKCPVVPTVIIDSYKAFGVNSLKRTTVKVKYLPPIMYDEYKDMKTPELCAEVQRRIDAEIAKLPKKI
ncbi:MAG: 1-acyl-sn-glycerol-3-phosphate acyltransferase [Ruminococcaceae bacterium]|nr:1-acyl-sn-glycerol-3-phosphate acyltransferase [Oscillospiraceae bacterium]